MVVKSTYRFEFVYFVLSCIAIAAIYMDSNSIQTSVFFFVPIVAGGVIGIYLHRVNSIELLKDKIIMNKIGRRLILNKGEVQNYWRLPIGTVFILWLSSGARVPCVLPFAYSRSDISAIEHHIKLMFKNRCQNA